MDTCQYIKDYLDIGGRQIPIEGLRIQRIPKHRHALMGWAVPIPKSWAGTATLLFDDITFLLNCTEGQLMRSRDGKWVVIGKVFIAGIEATQGQAGLLVEFVGSGALLI